MSVSTVSHIHYMLMKFEFETSFNIIIKDYNL